MDNERLMRAFGEIDDEYIQTANELYDIWQESQKGVIVRADSSRRSPWRTIIASVACTAAALFGVFVLMLNVGKIAIIDSSASSDVVSGEMTASNSENTASDPSVGGNSAENPSQQNISYNLTLPANTPRTVSQIRLEVRKWKEDEIESIFLDGKTVVDQYTYEPDFFPGDLCYVYRTSDDWQIIRAPGQFTVDNWSAKDGNFHYGTVCSPLTSVCHASDEELSAFSRDNAVKRVNEILDRLDIPYGVPYIIPVKADMANRYLKSFEGRQGFSYTPWGEENEVYILIYPLIYEGIELTMDEMKLPGESYYGRGASIEVVVSKNDLISIRGKTIYQTEYKTEEQITVKYNADYGLNKIKEFYSQQIISEEIQFSECKLVYVPVKKESEECLSFAPAWEFDGDEESRFSPFKRPISQYVYVHNGNRYPEY